ncbi:UNVERIFIED_CONTAM: hypothetical protein GTU68_034328 [Idotea baltica]|nr:hypothetical protein [Idotea baltica]
METAIFGGGCFWCVEALLRCLKGVQKVMPGYSGGQEPFPKYEDVKKGLTGHIEVVLVEFDPKIITYESLFDVFMNIHDPTQEDGQGEEDIGTQYLSSIFCVSPEQYETATKLIHKFD